MVNVSELAVCPQSFWLRLGEGREGPSKEAAFVRGFHTRVGKELQGRPRHASCAQGSLGQGAGRTAEVQKSLSTLVQG